MDCKVIGHDDNASPPNPPVCAGCEQTQNLYFDTDGAKVDIAGVPVHNCRSLRSTLRRFYTTPFPARLPPVEVGIMPDLNDAEVQALAAASRITIPDDLAPEVRASLNGLLAALDAVVEPDVAGIEPLPIIVSATARQQETP